MTEPNRKSKFIPDDEQVFKFKFQVYSSFRNIYIGGIITKSQCAHALLRDIKFIWLDTVGLLNPYI